MRLISNTYSLTATDADGIAQSQTPTGAGNLTLNGVLVSGGSVTFTTAQHVTITCAGADSGRTFTVTGTDWKGNALTENIAGSASSVTVGVQNFLTVTSIAVDAATAGAVTAGVDGTAETPWIPLDHYQTPFNYGYHVDIGTATFTVEGTLDLDSPSAVTVQASGSTDVFAASTIPVRAVRLKVTAFTSGNIVFRVLQAGK